MPGLPVTSFTIETHSINIFRTGTDSDCPDASAMIECIGGGNEIRLYFVPLDKIDSDLYKDKYDSQKKTGDFFLPCEHYAWYVDLLRNEKPVMGKIVFVQDPSKLTLYTG